MRSPAARAAIAVGAIAVVVVLFVVLAGGDDGGGSDSTTTTRAQETTTNGTTTTKTVTVPAPEQIVVRGGEPVGGVKEIEVDSGDRISFKIRSDVSDEVHVHGYDRSKPVPAGGSVSFSFPASIEGVFEVELEQRGVPIAQLRVNP